MSNIHQNDELLRVQDQNYDIVFNYDKHENGGVAVHAEKDGKNHKVNPEYARAALVKQIGSGGGWPADLPKPSVGGYGYTEQGEQTVITWDGDTEGKVLSQGGNYDGTLCKISNKTPAISDLVGGVLVVMYDEGGIVSAELSEKNTFAVSQNVIWGCETFFVALEDGATFTENEYMTTLPEAGIYSLTTELGARVSSLTYGGDTVHKIDEKYLPASGGDYFYVTFNYDDNNGITLVTSVAEMEQAVDAGKIFKAILNSEYDRTEAIYCGGYDGKDIYALFTSGIYSNQMEFFNVHYNNTNNETTMAFYTLDVTPS